MLMHFLLMTAKQEAKELGMELPEAAAQAMVHLVAGLHSEIIGFMTAHPSRDILIAQDQTVYGGRWSQEEVDRFEIELNKGMRSLTADLRNSLCHDVWHKPEGPWTQEFPCPSCNEDGEKYSCNDKCIMIPHHDCKAHK